uniref:Putative secreted protein n=1 Tax=Lutzomyia longipalpis TaxID=7200 RepID=A0A7G3ALW2_LUTLO
MCHTQLLLGIKLCLFSIILSSPLRKFLHDRFCHTMPQKQIVHSLKPTLCGRRKKRISGNFFLAVLF